MKMHWRFGTFGAVLASASGAEAQVGTVAATRVEASGQVRIVGDETDRLLISTGGLTFSLSMRDNGRLALAMAGASMPLARQDPAGTSDTNTSLTGSSPDRETVSLSVAEADPTAEGPSASGQDHLRLVIASFN